MQTLATMEAAIGPICLAVVLALLGALFLQQQKDHSSASAASLADVGIIIP